MTRHRAPTLLRRVRCALWRCLLWAMRFAAVVVAYGAGAASLDAFRHHVWDGMAACAVVLIGMFVVVSAINLLDRET